MATAVEKILDGTILGEQIASEEAAIERGVARYRKLASEAINRGEGAGLKPAERMTIHWFEPLVWKLKQEIRSIKRGDPGPGRGLYGPVIQCLDVDRLAYITIHTALSRCMSEPSGDLVPRMSYAIGSAVIAEIHMDLMKQDPNAKLRDLDKKFKKLNTQRVNWWAKKTLDQNLWNRKVCVQLGTRLMWCLIETASSRPYDEEFSLAFHHEKQWRDNQKKGVIRMDDEVFDAIEQGHGFRQGLRPRYQPMKVAPYPWSAKEAGGYVRVRTPLITKPTPDQEEALAAAEMDEYYEGLNAVNSQAWQVNNKILHVIEQLWDQGGGTAGVPARNNRAMPPKPADLDKNQDALKAWKREAHEVHSINAALKGARVEFLHKLHLSNDLKDSDFYIPHNACFRSRVYPIPLYLHPQGDDTARALLLFGGDPEPLDEEGTLAAYIQAANMWGEDKLSLEERVDWTNDHLEQIRTWAEHPLEDTGWTEADEPLQFLATCMAIRFEDVGARMPFQIDGSLNGLAHLTAQARCELAARVVNMMPSGPGDKPADGYREVGDAAVHIVREDVEGGIDAARLVSPFMEVKKKRRTLAKRPTMTRTYGVTRVGVRDQVKDDLKKMGMAREDLYPSSRYLGGVILDAIADLLGGANDVFEWLVETSKILVKERPDLPLDWVTPLGFHVVQPYRQWGKCTVKTCLQRITLAYRLDDAKVHAHKQVLGIVANWVHSIDASHLLRCAIRAALEGLAFGCVHDSIWTHGNSIGRMHRIVREEFLFLHDENLLEQLAAHWRATRPGVEFPDPPAQGDYDLENVLESTYFFS